MWDGMGWNEIDKFVKMSPLGAFVSQSLWFLVQGSSLTPTMEDEVWHQGADALH